jgi:hypothetical protein
MMDKVPNCIPAKYKRPGIVENLPTKTSPKNTPEAISPEAKMHNSHILRRISIYFLVYISAIPPANIAI